ncbi:MAG: hypothetical protein WC249_00400 [Patescibacteria group bacterium]|jgi:hypothetical protein
MFSYRSLLKQAWIITWRNKYLWFLGLFAALVTGGGAWEYQMLSQSLNQGLINSSYYQLSSVLAISDLAKNFLLGIVNLFQYDFLTIINIFSALLITVAILCFFIWLAVVSQAGLIYDVKKILNNKKKEQKLSLRDSLTAGHDHFWSVLSLNLTIKVITAFIFFIISLPLLFLAIKDLSILAVIYTILFVIFVPISMGSSLMINYVIAYRVLNNYSFIVSLEKGAVLFKNNWLISLEMGVILFIINFLASGLILIILSLLLLPLLLLGLILNLTWLTTLIIFFALIIIVIFGSALTSFQIATWTSLFLRLNDKGGIAKLERLFNRQE